VNAAPVKTPPPARALCALVLAALAGALVGALPLGACSSSDHAGPTDAGADGTVADAASDAGPIDAGPDVPIIQPDAMPPSGAFCALPGSYVWTAQGVAIVPGAKTPPPDLGWLTLPQGFCAHYFGHVPTARQIRVAPGGDVFVASPTTTTTGGANNGIAGIVVLPDDDHDGTADQNLTFLDNLPSVQGLLFTGGYLYYQDNTIIRRVPFSKGDRQPSGASQIVTTMSMKQASEHWPKVMDVAQDGTIYVTNGGSQFDACESNFQTYAGGVYKLNPDGSTSMVCNGFRNPIALRCETDHDVCLAAELALDYSWNEDGREKIVPVRQGDNWGYPCCATQNTPYTGVTYADTKATPDCSNVAPESASFLIGHTPFGIDFESGLWPAPWGGRAFVTLHGDAARWEGARVVGLALDPATGLPLPSTDLDGGSSAPNMMDFATGWDDGQKDHGRPAAITFAPDGRMFLGDDQRGFVVWIAPVGLMQR
jgi:glucose/arabinose dehydrogenase